MRMHSAVGASTRCAAAFFIVALAAACSSSDDAETNAPIADAAPAQSDARTNDADSGSIGDSGAATNDANISGDAGAIDWSPWDLQEPDGTMRTSVAGVHDAYFFPDGTFQSFVDTATGITTSGSLHPRCELREKNSWKASATNTLTVSGKVMLLGGGSSGKTTIGQVFNGTSSITLLELEYLADGSFSALYEEAKGNGTTTPLSASAALGTSFTYQLALSNGLLTVSIDGTNVLTMTPSAAVSGNDFFFKAGNYDQTAVAGAVTTTPYATVEFDAIALHHD